MHTRNVLTKRDISQKLLRTAKNNLIIILLLLPVEILALIIASAVLKHLSPIISYRIGLITE